MRNAVTLLHTLRSTIRETRIVKGLKEMFMKSFKRVPKLDLIKKERKIVSASS